MSLESPLSVQTAPKEGFWYLVTVILSQWYRILYNLVAYGGASNLTYNINTKTGNYTAVAGDVILGNTTGGGFTVTLPAASLNKGAPITIKKISADGNTLTVANTGADTTDGVTPQLIIIPNVSMSVISDGGTVWRIV